MYKLKIGNKTESYKDPASLIKDMAQYTVDLIQNGEKGLVLQAATGIGKSTHFIHHLFKQLTKGGEDWQIHCSQVTIQNTISITQYMVDEYEYQLGRGIGYETAARQIKPTNSSFIVYQTQQITTNQILRKAIANPGKMTNKCLILDEIHSDSIQTQEQLAFARNIIQGSKQNSKRDQPFIIVQSASINPQEISKYLNNLPIMEIQGSRFPIQELYLDDINKHMTANNEQLGLVDTTVNTIMAMIKNHDLQKQQCSMLVFFSRTKWIQKVADKLQKQCQAPIYEVSAQMAENKDELMNKVKTPGEFRIILTTNFMETGFTIPDLKVCIDTLKFKNVSYDPLRKQIIIVDLPICKKMQEQRRGRVGRTSPGIYVGLCTRKVSKMLMDHREYQIQIRDLRGLIMDIGIQTFQSLQFLAKIPIEHFYDFQQINALYGLTEAKKGPMQQIFQGGAFKFDLQQKILLCTAIQANLSISDALIIICYMTNFDQIQYEPKTTSQFIEFINLVKSNPFGHVIQTIMKSYRDYCKIMVQQQIDIYFGASFVDNVDAAEKAISIAFYQHILTLNRDHYVSNYGVQIPCVGALHQFQTKGIKKIVTNMIINSDEGVQLGLVQAIE